MIARMAIGVFIGMVVGTSVCCQVSTPLKDSPVSKKDTSMFKKWITGQRDSLLALQKDASVLAGSNSPFRTAIPAFLLASPGGKKDTSGTSISEREEKLIRKRLLAYTPDSIRREARKGLPRPRQSTPFLQFTGGYASYGYDYRSNLDTPYAEKNISQHQVLSSLGFTVAGFVPIRVNTFVRRSNSVIFQDITDLQVAFDAAAYRNRIAMMMRERLMRQAPGQDSLTRELAALKKYRADQLAAWLKDPLTHQKLIEANEIIRVPKMTYDMRQPDSTNSKHHDSLAAMARLFLDLYTRAKGEQGMLATEADSLRHVYEQSVAADAKFKQLAAKGPGNGSPSGYGEWEDELRKYSPGMDPLPAKYKWLLGLRSLSVGRSPVNASELTAKNISVNGINMEYNSWYYFSVSAGLVDYRFHDFVVHRLQQPPQYMYLMRFGVGMHERSYFIASVFGGRKQLLTSTVAGIGTTSMNLTGFSLEGKWQLNRATYVVAEAAESFSPDLQAGIPTHKSFFDLSDKSNKALSVKVYSWMRATGTRLEGQYKFTGANFQSFNSFQTNSQLTAWYVKAEQDLFHRQLKLVASVRTNNFSNPYIVQNYQANTVFKTLSLTFHRKAWPTVTIGYMPMSQLTMVGTQLEESRFQTLNASLTHFYKVGQRQTSTTIVYTRFYNNSSDTGFIYYNSTNLYVGQTFFFRDFTGTVALSYSKSPGYEYDVAEGSISLPVTKVLSLSMGAKLNSLDQSLTGVGGFVDANILVARRDRLSARIERGYLPGSGSAAKLVSNTIGRISYMKIFK